MYDLGRATDRLVDDARQRVCVGERADGECFD